ncbi:tectonic-3-like isoform X3 [Chanodichthys erythropterus]|uniref:tectonic-3-like isoform X3 n=1 Tax=Chanodichthys erythropterus TaxID=933992 RepID=UPI00351E6B60
MSKGFFRRVFQLVLFPIVFPQATCQNAAQHHSIDSTNSSVSASPAALNATFTDGSAEPISPMVTDFNITDQTPLSTDLSPYPFIFTDNAPTNQSRSTTEATNELRAEINSSYPLKLNTNDSSATATPKGTFTGGSAVLPTDATIVPITSSSEKQSADQTSARFHPKSLYPLLLRQPTAFNSQKNKFYKVDDIILTFYDRTSKVSTLRQPSPGPVSSACINNNPARFMRSSSLSCSRAVTARSCVDDRSLNALTYYTGFRLLRVPRAQVESSPDLVIPVSTVSDWPEPLEQNGSCLNLVSKVEYVIEYTGKGEIAKATLNIELLNTTIDTQLLQKHMVIFQLVTLTHPMATPTRPSPPEGLKPESPLVGWFGENSQPLTVLGLSDDGECSADLGNRPPVLFKQNTVTGCTFRSSSSDCGVLRAELLSILAGVAVPDLISMTAGSQTDQSRVISQDCSTPASDACETGCLLPVSLSLRVLWAQRGLRALPQNHILGAKFIFGCQRLKCPLQSSVPLTSEVMFSDATVYSEAPGMGEYQPEWKFTFAFFSRGVGEFDQE